MIKIKKEKKEEFKQIKLEKYDKNKAQKERKKERERWQLASVCDTVKAKSFISKKSDYLRKKSYIRGGND